MKDFNRNQLKMVLSALIQHMRAIEVMAQSLDLTEEDEKWVLEQLEQEFGGGTD